MSTPQLRDEVSAELSVLEPHIELPRFELTVDEMLKLDWLLTVSRGVEDAEDMLDDMRKNLLNRDGTKIEHSVDWQSVQRQVFPHLLVIMIKVPFRTERTFYDHPRYVVFPRTGQVLDLHAERIVTLESDKYQADLELAELVNQMSSRISKIEGSRRGEAMKHLRALHRVLGLKQ